MVVLGPSLGEELMWAGLRGVGLSWNADGLLFGRDSLSDEQNALLDQVLLKHDPTRLPAVTTVTAAQAKVALFKQGLLAQVEALIASYPPEAKIWYDNANVWDRTNPYNQGISMALGLTPEAEDALWALAAIQ